MGAVFSGAMAKAVCRFPDSHSGHISYSKFTVSRLLFFILMLVLYLKLCSYLNKK